ncbi:hypothetical protein N7535_008654 [Penicillium sp. DV-2018c]|nr:hypothetical protein N7461_002415 [Penicillium sp. DV-2018c]KAJ5563490.1 hypothetical protein N7535_008654 [Penicillium sp. DV-2018c]
MNYQANSSFVPTGPRNYQNSGGHQPYHRGNKRQQQADAHWNNCRNGSGSSNGNANWNSRNGNGNANNNNHRNNNQWNNHRNGHENGNGSNNNNGPRAGNSNPNYRGQNFNPNYKGKNFRPDYNPLDEKILHHSVENHPGPYSRLHTPGQKAMFSRQHQNSDVEMMDAPSDEPNDIEMPDAPPIFDDPVSEINYWIPKLQDVLTSLQQLEAFTKTAYAVKEIADAMIKIVTEHDPSLISN